MNQFTQPNLSFSFFPPVIKNLLIINVLVYLAEQVAAMTGAADLAVVLNAMALYPPGSGDIGASIFGTRGVPIPGFWPWQMITYSFLHSLQTFSHLLFNMFALWMFGVQLENTWGSKRFAVYYFVCVIGAAIVQMIMMYGSSVPTLGASGGVFGVLLAFGMMFPNQQIFLFPIPVPIKAKYFVAGYGLIELYSGVTGTMDGVAHFAHLGGMFFGFGLLLYWMGRLPFKPQRNSTQGNGL
jgi:membrane associated rhomboid family serine protease